MNPRTIHVGTLLREKGDTVSTRRWIITRIISGLACVEYVRDAADAPGRPAWLDFNELKDEFEVVE